jgi:hypothetical protein
MATGKENDGKWAPWWVYVVTIVACNVAKQGLIEHFPVAINVAITVALIAVLIVVITAVYRSMWARQNH